MPARIDSAEGRALFGHDPHNYDAIRPPYPEPVFDFLSASGALRAGVAALEIGVGSGLATRRLLEFGVDPLTLIEPDERFAPLLHRIARRSDADVRLITEPFEDAPLPKSCFDLVAAATSFHWIEPEVGLRKTAHVLRPGGYVAIWWHVFGDSTRDDPFHEATQEILAPLSYHESAMPGTVPYALDIQCRLQDFSQIGLFERAKHMVHTWTLDLDTPQVGSLYATFSNISRLPLNERNLVLQQLMEIADRDFNGRVTRNMLSPVYVARRNDRAG